MNLEQIIQDRLNAEMRRIDRFMLYLILGHLPVAAFLVPYGFGTMWIGTIGAAIAGVIALGAFFLLRGHALRLANALTLMFISYLFIACELGRIEMHFHIFGAMAFLVMYRDWKIFPTLTLFIALHHGIVNFCQSINVTIAGIPLRVFNYGEGWDIVAIHAVFVVFEASILIYMAARLEEQFRDQERRNLELDDLRRRGNLEIVEEVRNTSGHIIHSAAGLLGMASELSDKATHQASSIEEISASIEEMAAGLDGIFSTTKSQVDGIRDLTARMNTLREFNATVTMEVTRAAESIRETAEIASSGEKSLGALNQSITEIVASVEKMRDIVSIIRDIADKVNLLSLNASIEAARAGEAGRGFTVVAEEIAKLADQTGRSTKEIGALIETSTRLAESGLKNMDENSGVLRRIMQDIDSIHRASKGIAESSKTQQSRHEEVSARIQNLDRNSDFIKHSTEEQKSTLRLMLESLESLNFATESYATSAVRLTDIARENDSVTKHFAEKVTLLAAS